MQQKVHRLVMYFLRYIKPYILWDVRITVVAAAGNMLYEYALSTEGAREVARRVRRGVAKTRE